ncbi:MAG TPA: hypothetical protein VFJ85_02055 [Acidimicrobiales bacterium]|nr:hypothetical protein [Acidimicrobiales bacterium]
MARERSVTTATEDSELRSLDAVLRTLRPVLRWRYAVLVVVAVAFSLLHLRGTGDDWSYFRHGSQALLGHHSQLTPLPGGLHFYANYPAYQIGPLSLLVAAPLTLVGGGRLLAVLLMTAAAPLLILLLERAARTVQPPATKRDADLRALTVLFGGLAAVASWSSLSTIYAHLDDALTLAACTGAVAAVAARRPAWAGAALGAAVAAKPWGIVALPLAFQFSGRDRRTCLGVAAAIGAAAWLPFLLADSGTLGAIRPAVTVAPDSVMHLFGVPTADGPAWTRAVQLGLALVVGVLAVRRKKWPAVLLVAIAVRVALDPQVFLYYAAGLVLAALAWDLLRTRAPLPVWTLLTFVFLNDAYAVVPDPRVRAALRLAITAGLVAVVLLAPAARRGAVLAENPLPPVST